MNIMFSDKIIKIKKQLTIMRYLFLSLLMVVSFRFSVFAEDSDLYTTLYGAEIPENIWRVDGITYRVINEEGCKVETFNLDHYFGHWVSHGRSVDLPSFVVHDGMEYKVCGIGWKALDALVYVNVKLPECIKYIKDSNFNEFSSSENTAKATTLDFPIELERIGSNCFNRTGLASIKFPPNLVSIGQYSFNDNEFLTELEFDNSIEVVDEYCFNNNINLKEIYLPNSLRGVLQNSFSNCEKLERIRLPRYIAFEFGNMLVDIVSVFNECPNIKVIEWESKTPVALPNSFNAVDKANCTVIVPDGYKSVYEENEYWKDFIIVEKSAYESGVQIVPDPEETEEAYYTLTGFRIRSKENLEKGQVYLKVTPKETVKFVNI